MEEEKPWFKKKLWWILGGVLAVLMLMFAASYSIFLGARYAPGLRFKILGPSSLVTGTKATITWDSSPENYSANRLEKIEVCKTNLFWPRKCTLLASSVPNKGEAIVNVPKNLFTGIGYIRLTARLKTGILIADRTATKSVKIVKGEENNNDGGSKRSGGGGGSSSGGGGSSSNQTPSPSMPTSTSSDELPVVLSYLCLDNEPWSVLVTVYSQSDTGGDYGFHYRKVGTSDWQYKAIYFDDTYDSNPHHEHFAVLGVNPTSPAPEDKLEPNTQYEAEFNALPGRLFTFNTSKVGDDNDCHSENMKIPENLSNRLHSPEGLQASNIQLGPAFIKVSYNTNLPVFVTQTKVQVKREGEQDWKTYNSDKMTDQYSPSFYKKDTSHVVDISYAFFGDSDTTIQVRITNASEQPISPEVTLTLPN